LQAIQLITKNTELGTQVPHKRLIAECEMRLPRADDHAFHLVDEAPDDDPTILLALY
jgi:hypothetical protein